jgi:hypothetical protein
MLGSLSESIHASVSKELRENDPEQQNNLIDNVTPHYVLISNTFPHYLHKKDG